MLNWSSVCNRNTKVREREEVGGSYGLPKTELTRAYLKDLAGKLDRIDSAKRTLEATRLQEYNAHPSKTPLNTPAHIMDMLPSSDVWCEGTERNNRYYW